MQGQTDFGGFVSCDVCVKIRCETKRLYLQRTNIKAKGVRKLSKEHLESMCTPKRGTASRASIAHSAHVTLQRGSENKWQLDIVMTLHCSW